MPGKTEDMNKLRCSFCGKTQDQVKKLIAGLQGADKAKYEKELAAIQKEYESAKAKNDQIAYAKALDKLRNLQKTIGASALDSLM